MTIVLYKEHIVHWCARLFPEDCLGFAFCPLGLPLTSCLLPPASCLLDCLGFAFGPPAVSYKPGSTVNRHSYKSLFLFTFFKSENENANKGDECWNFHQQNWFVVYRGFHVFLSFERLQSLLCVVLDCYFAWKLSSVFVRQLWQNTKFIIMKSGQFAINYWFNISFCFIFFRHVDKPVSTRHCRTRLGLTSPIMMDGRS